MSAASSLESLQAVYKAMQQLAGQTPQDRGRRFNGWLADLLRDYGIDARENQRSVGEIDVVFAIGDTRYILEAKWSKSKADTGQLAKLHKRVRQRLSGTYGVFVSMAGYTGEALSDLVHGDRLELILLDSEHIEAMLGGEISPQTLLSELRDAAAFTGRPYTPMSVVRSRAVNVTGRPVSKTVVHIEEALEGAGPALPSWDPQQSLRANPSGLYVTFEGRQGIYWVLVAILLLASVVAALGVIGGPGLWRVVSGVLGIVALCLVGGFWRMAMRPVRLEIGAAGIQAFFPRNCAWMPWDRVDRAEVVRVDGNLAVVAWSMYATVYPTAGEAGMGAHYVPSVGAVALCPLGPLRAKRHDVARALQLYGKGRC
ncbi:restriction endonuclease [Nocardia colli]|uniref:Restriction endonuclease n=1 Tax=Nocardia colli TaxID=2545717 RepID=A0A5N0EQW4_9NOCA|nr:restriction endonuclease [Nocardia colli]KAA8890585.1 restriction endonuclease [Nocardia colli]